MNSRKKIILILSLFIIALSLHIGFVMSSHLFQSLDGKWEFYQNQLLTPEEISTQTSSAIPVNKPGKWNGYIQANHKTPFGYGISGGILQPIKLSTTEQIMAKSRSAYLGDMFISITYVLISLAFLILFLFIRSKEVLSIGLSVLFTALFFMTHGGKLLLVEWFPNLDYDIYLRITILAAAGLIYFYAQYKIKVEFLTNTSHELRTPLHGIINISQSAAPSYMDYGGEMHVLVVDDDPVNIHVILQLLASEQYRVTIMSRSEEVLAHLIQNKPEWDLVILDVMLPQLSGYEVCRKLREYYALFELPIIMLTAQSQLGDLKAAFEAGANDYTVKPVNGEELKARIRTLLQMKRAVIDHIHLETALLQAQIKPHFLFNTLNTIASLGEEDSNQMRELLMEFGNYLRASFDSKNLNRFVPISHEMALVQSYLYIEKVRFAERLQTEIIFPEGLEFMIPPLTLQPIIENAVRHGIMKRMEGGKIQISAKDLGDEILVTVCDNGVGLTGAEIKAILAGEIEKGGIGLMNTHRRLKHYYGYGLTIESIPMQGTRVSMQIPKLK